MMNRSTLRLTTLAAFLGALMIGLPGSAGAQYFGRNKVQYEKFNFSIMKTPHFDLYFYPAESLVVHDAGRMAERWYTRHSDSFRHTFDRKSVVFYADQPDFQQTNVVGDALDEGTGGVTEGMRTRVVMPFTGIYSDNDHVLGHELVHVFQYSVAEAGPGGLQRLNALPLWLIEGMAEYFSLGRDNSLTAMWLRDAAERDKLPTIHQLTTDPRFFPYRYGQALWAYVGGRWGDRAVVDVYRTSLRIGFEEGIRRVLGVSTDSLSKDWISASRRAYLPILEGRTRPNQAGDPVLQSNRKTGEMNLAPTVSPDGRLVAFFARRGLFEIELFVADAQTGRVIKKLAGPTSNSHFDAITFISSSGAWKPDNKKFAFIAQAEGNHEIAILDVESGNIDRRIRVPGVGAISNIAWSPDGRTLAFSGQEGGLSDLYLIDESGGSVRKLTNDRFGDIQPAWSPDGKTIAFSSDRGAQTNFETMTFSPLQLATIDVATGKVNVYSPFSHGIHLNPQYSPDGRSLFFISDQDGFADIYRLELANQTVSRVTRLSTGVSGITSTSPALTVALTSGRMMFSVFQDQGYSVFGLDSSRTHGEPVTPTAAIASASILPPGDTPRLSTVTPYLRDPLTGLVSGNDFSVSAYHSSFSLDAVGQPSLGVSAGGPFGTNVVGGVSFLFGDQLSDRQIGVAIQANGQVQDIGGQLQYANLKNRWNWGASIEHIPYAYGYYGNTVAANGAIQQDFIVQRIFLDQAGVSTAYPFSSTQRIEFGANMTRIGYSTQVQSVLYDAFGQPINQSVANQASLDPVYYGSGSMALVEDRSYEAFTGPIDGSRYRFEVAPTVGTLTYTSLLADYRKYFFMRPFTLAFRGLHYGRYGRSSEDSVHMYPLFLGEETVMRGYSYGSIDQSECQATSCPVFSRLLGSRLAVVSAEFRIPLLGVPEYGLLNFPYLPTTISPFIDAGEAWDASSSPTLSTNTNDFRIPVVSAGISARMNVLGFAVFEFYAAHPFQRPGKNWV
ncbi:MAG: peptidase dipeptidylpeptidase domain protein, partial [Gemmatimonadetes bacterium]|nr:peptidase dipeptidylpeptidase domain protein [Gemmatimonadota bacterium]